MKDYEDEAFDEIEKAQQRIENKKDAALRLAREALTAPSPMIIYTALAAINEALGGV